MYLGGGNSNILDEITPKIGEDEPILTIFVQMGRNHQPGIYFRYKHRLYSCSIDKM